MQNINVYVFTHRPYMYIKLYIHVHCSSIAYSSFKIICALYIDNKMSDHQEA